MSDEKKKIGGLFGGKKKKGCCDFEIVEEKECDCNDGCCGSGNKSTEEKE